MAIWRQFPLSDNELVLAVVMFWFGVGLLKEFSIDMISEKCFELVKRFEGFSSRIYICPVGYPIAGYRHVVIPEEKKTKRITKEEAEELLQRDSIRSATAINPLIQVNLHQYMFDTIVSFVILSFVYSVGIFVFRSSGLRKKVNAGVWAEASNQFSGWVYAGGRKLPEKVI